MNDVETLETTYRTAQRWRSAGGCLHSNAYAFIHGHLALLGNASLFDAESL